MESELENHLKMKKKIEENNNKNNINYKIILFVNCSLKLK